MPPDRQFVGFDAYRKAIDCLRPGDVAMLTTHAAFRPTHLEYAVEKGVNVFMEKSFAPDPGGVQQVLAAGEAAEKKNLKIAAGLMCRHSVARQALIQKIRDGEMGDDPAHPRLPHGRRRSRWARGSPTSSELLWQIRRPYFFLWVSGGLFIEMTIHQIDECCWIKDAWPVSAHGIGGRTADSTDCSQNLDSYSIEYTFADGTKAQVVGRYMTGLPQRFRHLRPRHEVRRAVLGQHPRGHGRMIYKDQRIARDNIAWKADQGDGRPLAGRVERPARGHPQRPAPQREPARLHVEPGRHHGPGGRPHRPDRHLGRDDLVELPVLPDVAKPDQGQPVAGPGRRQGPLPGARSPANGPRSDWTCSGLGTTLTWARAFCRSYWEEP